jgi:ATP phosphoribosyltransferase
LITIALSKGRIFEETLPLLKAAGIEVLEDPEKSRKLILTTNQPDVRVLVVRATDVPTYVQYGGADMGITGKDTLLEHGSQGLYQPLDLHIAKCRISVAVRSDFDYQSAVKKGSRLTVATKYVAISRDFFASKGVHVDLIKLYGSMELAPLVGLADAIVDLGLHWQHPQGQSSGRGGAHHGHQLATGGESGGAQAQTGTVAPDH